MDKQEIAKSAISVAGKSLSALSSGMRKLMPKGGIRHPDSMITQRSNRSLYLPGNGHSVSPIPGLHPRMDKSLLTGGFRQKQGTDGLQKLRDIQTTHVHKNRGVKKCL